MRLLLLLSVMTLAAQESTNAIPRNKKALQAAIAGIGKRPVSIAPKLLRMAPPPPKSCSIPLQSMQIDQQRQFTAKQIPAQTVEPMPQAALPAPACDTFAR